MSLSVDRRGAHFGLLSELHDTLFVEDNDVDSLSFSNVMFTGQNDLNRLLRHEKPDKKDTQSYCKNQKNIREVLSYFTDLFISEIRAQATPYRSLPSLCVNAAIYIYESFTSVLTESYKKTQNKMLIDSVLQALCDGNKNLNNLMIKIRNLDEATVITTNINRENITSICRIILLSTLIDIADISNTETSLLKENDKFIALTQAEEKLKKSILHNNDLERLRNIIDKKEREFDAFKNLSIVKNFSYNETKKNSTDTIIGWCRTDETLSQSNYFRKKSKKRRKEDLKETQKTKSNKSKKKKTKGQSSIPNSRSIVCESHTKKNQSTQTSTSTNLAPQAPPYVYSIRLFNDNLRIEETTTPVFKITTKKAVRRPKISTVINSNTGVRTITFDFTDENNTTLNHTLCL